MSALIENNCKTMLKLDSLSLSLIKQCKLYSKTTIRAMRAILEAEPVEGEVWEPLLHDGTRKSYTIMPSHRLKISARAAMSGMKRDDWVNMHIHTVAPRLIREAQNGCIITTESNSIMVTTSKLPIYVAEFTKNKQSFSVNFYNFVKLCKFLLTKLLNLIQFDLWKRLLQL